MNEIQDELQALRAELVDLRREVERLQGQAQPTPVPAETSTTRRGMLRLAGATALGTGLALWDKTPVAADNGLVTTNTGVTTTLSHNSATGFHFRASDSPYATNSEVIQASAGPTNRHCLRAFSNNGTSAIFVRNEGVGSAILAGAQGSGPAVTVVNTKGPILGLNSTPGKVRPGLRTDEFHVVGSLDVDGQGNLWYCIGGAVGGPPGNWQQLGGPTTAGAFHPISPVRMYDSRLAAYTPNGRLNPNTSITVPVRDAHHLTTGAVVTADAVPAGATAIAYNATAVATTGSNFLAVTPGGSSTFAASSVNWSTAGINIANASVVPIDVDRQVKVFCGTGSGSAHVLIDVVGYYL